MIQGAFGAANASSVVSFGPDTGAGESSTVNDMTATRFDSIPEGKLTALIAVAAAIAGIRCAAPNHNECNEAGDDDNY